MGTEEVFAVHLSDGDCSQVVTVGDFYRLVLAELNLPHLSAREIEYAKASGEIGRNRMQDERPHVAAWSTPDTWITLKAIIQDQLQLKWDEIHEEARFVRNLGCE